MRALRSELVALTTTRALAGHLAVAAVLGLLPLLILPLLDSTGEAGGPGVPDFATADGQAALLAASSNAFLLSAILATVVATRRHRHRTIVPQLLATPSRVRVVLAQTGAVALGGVLVGAVAVAVGLVAGAGGLAIVGSAFALTGGQVARLVLVALAAGVVGGCVGNGVGAVLRSSGAAITLVVVLVLVVEGLVGGLLPEIGRWSPSNLLSGLEPGPSSLGPGPVGGAVAMVALAAYAAVATAAGIIATVQRDAV
jgi:ABC-2 type transport system permease protein